MQLTPEQVAQFAEDGYLLLRGALTDADLDPIIAEYAMKLVLISRPCPRAWPAKRVACFSRTLRAVRRSVPLPMLLATASRVRS